jgi:radical SAM protein with 4Fe4S-binding SPASM domain
VIKYHQLPFDLREIKIEVSYRCPLACLHCSSDAYEDHAVAMDVSACLRIIEEAYELGKIQTKSTVEEISFSGGEPLIWDGILEAIKITRSKGMKATIYSSGNIPRKQKMLEDIARAGLNKIVFSIFGATAETHEYITRSSKSFENTLEAVEIAKKLGLNPEFHFVPFNITFRELDEIVELTQKLGIQKLSVLRFVPQGRGYVNKQMVLDRAEYIELKNKIKSSRMKGDVEVRTGSPFNFLLLNDQPACCSAIDRAIIGPDLLIYPCDAFKQISAEQLTGTLEYSSLAKWSLRECWQNSPFLQSVRKYLTTDFEEPCVSCKSLEKCLSGCLAQKVLITGDMSKQPDPSCILRKNK